ncbi:MAG TPA: 7-carboxy-7-deazaguanine synthase QueE, partial [bacterium]
RNLWKNLEKLVEGQDEIKFVIRDEADYNYAKDAIGQYRLAGKQALLFSPAHDDLEPAKLSEWILRDHLLVRLNLQSHKYIWPNDTRGK